MEYLLNLINDKELMKNKNKYFIEAALTSANITTEPHSVFKITPLHALTVMTAIIKLITNDGTDDRHNLNEILLGTLEEQNHNCIDGFLKRVLMMFEGNEEIMNCLQLKPVLLDEQIQNMLINVASITKTRAEFIVAANQQFDQMITEKIRVRIIEWSDFMPE
jgi:hypothetical protein